MPISSTDTDFLAPEARSELAPTGILRAAIHTGNRLLVSGTDSSGDPQGVAPDMAAEAAARLGLRIVYVPFSRASLLTEAAATKTWDICLVGADPARAEKIAFSPAYCEIEATYLVPAGSPMHTAADVDRVGTRIAVLAGSAYGLWLDRNIEHATLCRSDSSDGPLKQFVADKLEALAGLKPRLLRDADQLHDARILDGNFTTVQQAIGTPRQNSAGAAFLRAFVEDAKVSGLVARLIARNHALGLSVASGQ